MVKLNKCCFCIDLASGAKILGWLGIIENSLYILYSLYILFCYDDFIEDESKREVGVARKVGLIPTMGTVDGVTVEPTLQAAVEDAENAIAKVVLYAYWKDSETSL
jgi:hypothetical protein